MKTEFPFVSIKTPYNLSPSKKVPSKTSPVLYDSFPVPLSKSLLN
jgi:hypothetical protein